MNNKTFHLAFLEKYLQVTYCLYSTLLGCKTGRASDRWIDDFFCYQLFVHLKPNQADGKKAPVRHFGAIFLWHNWHALAERLKAATIEFVIEPYIRFEKQAGNQITMFFYDLSGNALMFKSFKDQ